MSFTSQLIAIADDLPSVTLSPDGSSARVREIKIRERNVILVVETSSGAYREVDVADIDHDERASTSTTISAVGATAPRAG
jgi:hypothetical protein